MPMLFPPSTQTPSGSEVEQPVADLELLVREARARQRRRRLHLTAALLGAAAIGGAVYGSLGRGSSENAGVKAIPHRPAVDVRAFAHRGRLAFISRGTLWLLDGQRGTLRRMSSPHGFRPTAPIFSPDGKWLAYLETRPGATATPLYPPSNWPQYYAEMPVRLDRQVTGSRHRLGRR